ncbi:DUF6538 domain-containing protein [Gellertiella hungarica]|uniref:DUF6538 domain-containing protein n=1 Tax=Gellertiella hungarica TaxID=1572859 RepID=A0A7W6J8E0_9HYPH|nr:DUF6538 domain-containing protein [Gellertiella hungarica]MBB4066676.1 hypothetical protein [Gellertiella hungarica]
MAGKLRHWKERNGRYSARIVVPKELRPYLDGKTELEIQLGGDKREAQRNHAAAVASLQRQIGIARHKLAEATNTKPKPAPYPLTAQQIAHRDYLSQISVDTEFRAFDHRYAQFDLGAEDVVGFREGYAGKLSNEQLEELVGFRLARAQLAGLTDAKRGSPEWRELAMALCVSSYEALARQAERNDGVFNGKPEHPLLADFDDTPEEVQEPVSFDRIIDDEVERRARGKNAKPLPPRTVKKYRDNCASFCKWRNDTNALSVRAIEGKQWMEHLQDAGKLMMWTALRTRRARC